MEPSETRAALRILYVVASSDGDVSAEEERVLTAFAEDLRQEIDRDGSIDLAAEAAQLRSEDAKLSTFEAAVALATVDGKCSEREHATLEALRKALGVDLPLPTVAREERWAGRMLEARTAMRAAEAEFLHAVAKKRATGLSQEEYEALLQSLHEAQVAALHEVVDPAIEDRPSYVG